MSKEEKKAFLDKRHQKKSNGNGNGGGAHVNEMRSNSNNNQKQQQQSQNNQITLTLNSIMNNRNWRTSGQGLTKTGCVGHYKVSSEENIVLLESSANTCLCGKDFVVLEENNCKGDVIE